MFKQEGTTKTLSMKEYVPSVVVIRLRTKPQPRSQGLSSLPPLSLSFTTTMEAEKREPGIEVDETHLLLDCQRYSSMRDIFLSKIERKVYDIRKLSHENLISQLMNSNDYYVNLRLIVSTS